VTADAALTDVPAPDIVLVAGGMAAFERAAHPDDDPIIEWLRAVHPGTTWTASVCTGALLLGAAGLLHGKRATSHWFARDQLASYGATPVDKRVVFDGTIGTAARVSAGIDLALTLAAQLTDHDTARLLQLDMEYAPEPPFDAGTPARAGAALTEHLSALYRATLTNSGT
jgi:transcriptional regulator GlxA family with amidase domain